MLKTQDDSAISVSMSVDAAQALKAADSSK